MEKKQTILIIDDSPTEAQTVRHILNKAGFTVEWADNAIEGIELAKKLAPNLILMDVVMPGMNGFQATRRISRHVKTQHIPIIILTTKDQVSDKAWGTRQGASGYLTKPTDSNTLLNAIETILG